MDKPKHTVPFIPKHYSHKANPKTIHQSVTSPYIAQALDQILPSNPPCRPATEKQKHYETRAWCGALHSPESFTTDGTRSSAALPLVLPQKNTATVEWT